MTKVKKVGGRGTISYEKDEKPENWAGDSFRRGTKRSTKKNREKYYSAHRPWR